MKKILLLLTACLLSSTIVRAQATTYHAFPDSNAFWQFRHWNSLNSSIHDQKRLALQGDTIIGGNTYHKVFSLFDSTLSSPYSTYYAAIREQNKRIYTVIGNSTEHLLYDFNLLVGDTITYDYSLASYSPATFSRVVTEIDSALLENGTYRKRFSFAPAGFSSNSDTVYEGIGSIVWQGLFNPLINAWCTCGDGYEVTCIKEYDTTLYLKNPACDHCFCTFLTSTNEIEKQNVFQVFPNPTKGKFTIETNMSEKQTVQLFDINGRMVLNQTIGETNSIDATFLEEGIYNIKISSNTESANKKLIIIR